MKKRSFVHLAICLLVSINVVGQNITLTPNPALVIDQNNCIVLTVGETLSFERALSCGPDALIATNGGTTEVFRSSDQTFSYTFNSLGEHVVFCNASPSSAAVTATCVIVVAKVPTLGEWSLIVMSLLLLILGVVAVRTNVYLKHQNS